MEVKPKLLTCLSGALGPSLIRIIWVLGPNLIRIIWGPVSHAWALGPSGFTPLHGAGELSAQEPPGSGCRPCSAGALPGAHLLPQKMGVL